MLAHLPQLDFPVSSEKDEELGGPHLHEDVPHGPGGRHGVQRPLGPEIRAFKQKMRKVTCKSGEKESR